MACRIGKITLVILIVFPVVYLTSACAICRYLKNSGGAEAAEDELKHFSFTLEQTNFACRVQPCLRLYALNECGVVGGGVDSDESFRDLRHDNTCA